MGPVGVVKRGAVLQAKVDYILAAVLLAASWFPVSPHVPCALWLVPTCSCGRGLEWGKMHWPAGAQWLPSPQQHQHVVTHAMFPTHLCLWMGKQINGRKCLQVSLIADLKMVSFPKPFGMHPEVVL